MTPELSLVTGTLDRPDAFKRLLDSIIQHTSVEWELIVSDASEKPYSGPLPENVRLIHESPRLGHCRGYNNAFREANAPFIIWLNDDAEVCPSYDVESIRFMEKHPAIGLGALHYSENGGPFHVNEAWSCLYANFGIFRKQIGLNVGFFDEDLTMYGGDNSLAIRMLLSGYGVADIPQAKILHHSVNDPIRKSNQQYKIHDNRVLQHKYMGSHRQWLQAFRQHRVHTGTIAWSHGVEPSKVNR